METRFSRSDAKRPLECFERLLIAAKAQPKSTHPLEQQDAVLFFRAEPLIKLLEKSELLPRLFLNSKEERYAEEAQVRPLLPVQEGVGDPLGILESPLRRIAADKRDGARRFEHIAPGLERFELRSESVK